MQKISFLPPKAAKPGRIPNHLVYAGLFFLLLLQIFTLTGAQAKFNAQPGDKPTAAIAPLPPAYGKVIYCFNETSPKKLYIVGISHRGSSNRLNGPDTSKTQAEVYRIGEWLNLTSELNLLLPEGFFSGPKTAADFRLIRQNEPLDNHSLEKKLADESYFVNAEMLLVEQFQMRARQVEDRGLYEAVLNRLLKLENNADNPAAWLSLCAEIDYLQERRTAAILQKIPTVIEAEFDDGNIKNKNAMFTIGLDHIGTIINYLNKNKINIQSPTSFATVQDDYVADLNLIKEGFGIIIIIPKTLVQDQEVLKMTRLDGLI